MNEWGLKGTPVHKTIQCHNTFFKWSFVIVEEQWQIILFLCERRKRGSERPEPSNPKRTKGSFRCMVSIVRSTHLPSFIRRAGCCTSLGFPGRRQLLLHTIEQAKRVCPFQGMLELHKNIVITLKPTREIETFYFWQASMLANRKRDWNNIMEILLTIFLFHEVQN